MSHQESLFNCKRGDADLLFRCMWKMRDEMAANDPKQYRKYVDKNMAEM